MYGASERRGLLVSHLSKNWRGLWGARWRPGQQMRMAWCRRKVVLDEVTSLIQTGLDPTLAVQRLETQRQRNRQTLPSLIRALQAERRQLASSRVEASAV